MGGNAIQGLKINLSAGNWMNRTGFKEGEVIFGLHHAAALHPIWYTMRAYSNFSSALRPCLSEQSQERGQKSFYAQKAALWTSPIYSKESIIIPRKSISPKSLLTWGAGGQICACRREIPVSTHLIMLLSSRSHIAAPDKRIDRKSWISCRLVYDFALLSRWDCQTSWELSELNSLRPAKYSGGTMQTHKTGALIIRQTCQDTQYMSDRWEQSGKEGRAKK